jgi:hypothetical protein
MDRDKPTFEKNPKAVVRQATFADIDRLVELEFETFEDVYVDNPPDPIDVREMITKRLDTVQDLMIVGEVNGVIEGVMACQRTDLAVGDVKSWEETTNNGTLEGTHNPNGKNFYVVNLAVSQEGSKNDLSDQLIAMMIGKFIETQGNEGHLLSRIPQFAQWLQDEQHINNFAALSISEQDSWAEKYVMTTKVVDGQERLYDGVLQRYVDVGVKPMAVLRDSYQDPSSHNYEVLCVFENPLPDTLKRSRMASRLAGKTLQYAANHPSLLKYLP